jgi:hypothetical protein
MDGCGMFGMFLEIERSAKVPVVTMGNELSSDSGDGLLFGPTLDCEPVLVGGEQCSAQSSAQSSSINYDDLDALFDHAEKQQALSFVEKKDPSKPSIPLTILTGFLGKGCENHERVLITNIK